MVHGDVYTATIYLTVFLLQNLLHAQKGMFVEHTIKSSKIVCIYEVELENIVDNCKESKWRKVFWTESHYGFSPRTQQ